jgi:hypothetical protein
MPLLFAGGVMSLAVIAAIALLVLLENLVPFGPAIGRLAGAAGSELGARGAVSSRARSSRSDSLSQNLLHRFSFGELIDELVQIAYFLHQRIFDFFYANTAYYALDERTIWIDGWCLSKKGFEIVLLFYLLL